MIRLGLAAAAIFVALAAPAAALPERELDARAAQVVEYALRIAPSYFGRTSECVTLRVFDGGAELAPLRGYSEWNLGACRVWLAPWHRRVWRGRDWGGALLCGVAVHEYGHLDTFAHESVFPVMHPASDWQRAHDVRRCWRRYGAPPRMHAR